MTLPEWSDKQLAIDQQRAIDEFVDRRLAEPASAYPEHVERSRERLRRVLDILNSVGDPIYPDLRGVRAILLERELLDSFRYIAGPPISEDDLFTIATRGPKRVKKSQVRTDDTVATRIYQLVMMLRDLERFPWLPTLGERRGNRMALLKPGRSPTREEVETALFATSILQAAQSLATERRGFGRVVERRLRDAMSKAGLVEAPAPNRGKIDDAGSIPKSGQFYGECTFFGRKVDLLIGLPRSHVVLVEAKDSSSALNSVKRLSNDTGAKAKRYREAFGRNAVLVALLSGVYHASTLQAAQQDGLKLIWAHRLDEFVSWLRDQCGIESRPK